MLARFSSVVIEQQEGREQQLMAFTLNQYGMNNKSHPSFGGPASVQSDAPENR